MLSARYVLIECDARAFRNRGDWRGVFLIESYETTLPPAIPGCPDAVKPARSAPRAIRKREKAPKALLNDNRNVRS
jgi:hypothetical protein